MSELLVTVGDFIITNAGFVLIYALTVNLTAFILYGADKMKAKRKV